MTSILLESSGSKRIGGSSGIGIAPDETQILLNYYTKPKKIRECSGDCDRFAGSLSSSIVFRCKNYDLIRSLINAGFLHCKDCRRLYPSIFFKGRNSTGQRPRYCPCCGIRLELITTFVRRCPTTSKNIFL